MYLCLNNAKQNLYLCQSYAVQDHIFDEKAEDRVLV